MGDRDYRAGVFKKEGDFGNEGICFCREGKSIGVFLGAGGGLKEGVCFSRWDILGERGK